MNRSTSDIYNTFKGNRYTVEFLEDGVYIRVSPAEGGLTKKEETKILNEIKRKGIKDIDSSALFNAMYVEVNKKLKIAHAQDEKKIDEEIRVRVTNEGMEALAELLPNDGGDKLTFEKAMEELKKQGIVFGINENILRDMLSNGEYYKEIPIAVGRYPKDGKDAKIKYHIDFDRVAKPEILEDGTVNYRELDLVQNVTKGQTLASIIPPTEGIAGTSVLGKTIKAKSGKNIAIPNGKNVIISEDRLNLYAGIDGRAEMINGKIHVYSVYEVPGNVDNSTGDIDFVGNVIVNGNVLTGFKIKSGGYIEVRGVVEGATLTAEGDIILKQGMQGMGRGKIESQRNIVTRFIENGTVIAKGNITAEAILHSKINCGGKIEVMGRRGLIAGGSTSAGTEITAITIGSPMATATELEVGTSPLLREEYSRLVKEEQEINQEIKKADQILNLLNQMEAKKGLSPDKANLRLKTIRTKLAYSKKIPPIKARIAELDEIFNCVTAGRVNVKGNIYPGVRITIGTSLYHIREQEKFVSFVREEGDVVRTSYLG